MLPQIIMIMILLFIMIGTIFVSAISGRWIALEKGRSGTEGLVLGLLLGPLGVVIEAVLPEWDPPESDEPAAKPAWSHEFE